MENGLFLILITVNFISIKTVDGVTAFVICVEFVDYNLILLTQERTALSSKFYILVDHFL